MFTPNMSDADRAALDAALNGPGNPSDPTDRDRRRVLAQAISEKRLPGRWERKGRGELVR